jgi:hypothetical protein
MPEETATYMTASHCDYGKHPPVLVRVKLPARVSTPDR